MSVSLQKGQKVSLTKEGQEGLNQVIVGLGWDEAQANKGGLLGGLFGSKPQAIDCDASALMLRGGRLLAAYALGAIGAQVGTCLLVSDLKPYRVLPGAWPGSTS